MNYRTAPKHTGGVRQHSTERVKSPAQRAQPSRAHWATCPHCQAHRRTWKPGGPDWCIECGKHRESGLTIDQHRKLKKETNHDP